MTRKKKSNRDVIRSKLGGDGGGSMDYKPPSYGRGLVKNSDSSDDKDVIDEALLRELIAEIVRKCDDDSWCLFTKKKDKRTGKRRRLGTHSSKSGAERQERAIKAHGG